MSYVADNCYDEVRGQNKRIFVVQDCKRAATDIRGCTSDGEA
jgi:hypothetical protein